MQAPYLMQQTMRWFGPNDPVSLAHIRQAGCSGVVTALHQIPVGDIWPIEAIEARKAIIEAAGLSWKVIESLPVSEDIKRQSGDYLQHIEHYKTSLRNVAACGLEVVTYNFMPVLDWVRTDIAYPLPNGSQALYFERNAFIAFDLYLLKRPHAKKDYPTEAWEQAKGWYEQATDAQKEKLLNNAMLGLPGSSEAFTPDMVLQALKTYSGIDSDQLKKHLFYFLKEVVPVAESLGLRMAIHPDDPPYPVLGLPRVVSTEQDLHDLTGAVPSPANGLCFCTGSLGARPDNDIPGMLDRLGQHIHFLHLRNTRRDENGNFYEANHLEGNTNMYEVVKKVYALQQSRQRSLPMRPDHGHQMLDDLQKQTYPGYSAIGRLKGLAELRGLEYAVREGEGSNG